MTGSKYISLKHFRLIIAATLLIISWTVLLININQSFLSNFFDIALLSILQLAVVSFSENISQTKTFVILFILSSALLFVFEPYLIFTSIIFAIYKFRQNLLSALFIIFEVLLTGILIAVIFSFGINNYPDIVEILLSLIFVFIAGYLASNNFEVVFAAGLLYFIIFIFNSAEIRIGIIASLFFIYSLIPYKVDNNLGKIMD